MGTHHCMKCGETTYLDEDEEQIFEVNRPLAGNELAKCPYCIEAPISGMVTRRHMRMVGPGGNRGRMGYFSTPGEESPCVAHRDPLDSW